MSTEQRRSVESSAFADDPQFSAIAAQLVVSFIAALRKAGITVPVDGALTYAEAISAVGMDESSALYWAGRAALAIRHEDIETYDAVFTNYWLQDDPSVETVALSIARPATNIEHAINDHGSDNDEATPRDAIDYSARELLRHKDLASCSSEELAEARRLISELRPGATTRVSNRHVRTNNRHAPIDLPKTVRLALRNGGEPLRRAHQRRRVSTRRLILISDVSGSMEPYARGFLRFMHAAVNARPRGDVEAFALGTRLTRLTRDLESPDADRALRAVSTVLEDHGGGTRLGDGLRQFNRAYGAPGMARGSTVVVLSDGWDCGDELLLAAEMDRLHRLAHRLIWVNPLRASDGYAPIARGMAAALPHVDAFVDGHSFASLEELVEMIAP